MTRMSRWRKKSIQLYIARSAMRVNGETLVIRRERRQYVLQRSGADDGNRTHPGAASEPLEQSVWRDGRCRLARVLLRRAQRFSIRKANRIYPVTSRPVLVIV
jgi:hypothetical protein